MWTTIILLYIIYSLIIIFVYVVTSCDNSTNMPTTVPYVFIFLFSYFSVGQKIDNIQKIFSIEPFDPPTANVRTVLNILLQHMMTHTTCCMIASIHCGIFSNHCGLLTCCMIISIQMDSIKMIVIAKTSRLVVFFCSQNVPV